MFSKIINTWILRSKLNSLCAKMKLNKTNNQQKTPPTTLLYSTTKTTTTSTTTTHTNQIKNKKKNSQPLLHTLTPVYAMKTLHFYRTPPQKKPHTITMTKMMFQAKWTRRQPSCMPLPRLKCCWMPRNRNGVAPPPRRPITLRLISRRQPWPIVQTAISIQRSTR